MKISEIIVDREPIFENKKILSYAKNFQQYSTKKLRDFIKKSGSISGKILEQLPLLTKKSLIVIAAALYLLANQQISAEEFQQVQTFDWMAQVKYELNQKIEQGAPDQFWAHTTLASIYHRQGDMQRAAEHFLAGAEGGDLEAMWQIANMYEKGNSAVQQDVSKACDYYNRIQSWTPNATEKLPGLAADYGLTTSRVTSIQNAAAQKSGLCTFG